MAAQFVAASSQRLVNTAETGLFGTMPFTVGFWAYPTSAAATRSMWTLSDTAATFEHYHTVMQITAGAWYVETFDNVGSNVNFSGGTPAASQWAYLVYRAISGTNRRCSILQAGGLAVHIATTTADDPVAANFDLMAWGMFAAGSTGATNFFDGLIAETWYALRDVQDDGLALENATLRQLAYYGPFSVPHNVPKIIEYQSFRSRLIGADTNSDEVYIRGGQRKPWTNVNGVSLGQHPPLPGGYVRPSQLKRQLLI